ncbi:MAG: hypothetical protein Q7K57_14085 [Burkholderiaceae bacterium]|nr:hypothetical protein [Burkholderiaceae bacterium]
MSPNTRYSLLLLTVVLGLAAQLTGCASTTTPELDAKFGDAVRAAREAQTLNPNASANKDPVLGLDGNAAVNAIDRYQDSFKSPPKTFEVINIGGTLTGQ